MKHKTTTTDAARIIRERFFEGKPDRLAELEKMRADDAVARKLVELRTKADLTQRELAKLWFQQPGHVTIQLPSTTPSANNNRTTLPLLIRFQKP